MKRGALASFAVLLAFAAASAAFGQSLKGTVSFMGWGDEAERIMYEKVFKDFEAQNPGVKVNYIFTPDDYYTKLQTMIAGGTAPDLFYLAEGRISQFAKDGVCLDLGPWIKKYPELTADFVDGLLRYGNYSGKQYAIPKDWQPILMYVNADIFKAAGVPIPTSAWTIDDYLAIAKKLTKLDAKGKTAQWGAAVENYRADWMVFARSYGGEWFKNGKSNWSDPAVVKGMEAMCKVIADKSAPSPATLSGMGQSQTQLFETGKVGMFPTGRWAVPTYAESCKGFNWTAVEMPKGSARSNPIITAALTASASTKNPELTIALLRHILSDKSLATVMKLGIGMPPYKRLLSRKEYVSEPPSAAPFVATGAYIDQKVQYEAVATTLYAKYQDIISAQLDLALNGDISMRDAAAAIDKKANAELFK
jgi:multiple sugar transport system substrate-binding protein